MSHQLSQQPYAYDEKAESTGDLKHNDDLLNPDSESALIEQAMLRGEEETKLGFKGVFKLHYKAAMWSMLLSYVATERQ